MYPRNVDSVRNLYDPLQEWTNSEEYLIFCVCKGRSWLPRGSLWYLYLDGDDVTVKQLDILSSWQVRDINRAASGHAFKDTLDVLLHLLINNIKALFYIDSMINCEQYPYYINEYHNCILRPQWHIYWNKNKNNRDIRILIVRWN